MNMPTKTCKENLNKKRKKKFLFLDLIMGCVGGETVAGEAMNWADRSHRIPSKGRNFGFWKVKRMCFDREMKGFEWVLR